MTPEELTQEFKLFIEKCQERILGPGASQYYDPATQTQLFEIMGLGQLFEYAEEELQDLAIYAFMLSYRLTKIREALQLKESILAEEGGEEE